MGQMGKPFMGRIHEAWSSTIRHSLITITPPLLLCGDVGTSYWGFLVTLTLNYEMPGTVVIKNVLEDL